MLANSIKGSATPYRGGGIIIGDQRGGRQDATANKGAGVLDLPGDLEASIQANGTTLGTVGERMGGQARTLEVLEIFLGRQTASC